MKNFTIRFLAVAFTLALLIGSGTVAWGQTTVTLTPSSTSPWEVPAGVTEITVEVWGAGGRGGTRTASAGAGGGGGAGAYSKSIITVNQGTYNFFVGTGSNSGTTPGDDTWFGSSTTLMAKGGNSVPDQSPTAATGGSASAGFGDDKQSGGDGSGQVGGNSPNGGTGGAAVGGNNSGNPGEVPGGGGGGARRTGGGGGGVGGVGGDGRIVITYTLSATPTITSFAPTSACTGSGASVVISGTNFTGATAVTFFDGQSATFTVNSATQITATLPAGATTGAISVTTPSGTTNSATDFTVNALPTPTFTVEPGANTCASSDVTYTTQAAQSSYVWSVPGIENTDYTISAGGIGSTDNTVTLQWLTTGNKTVTVNYTDSNGCTGTSAASNTTTVNALPTYTVAYTDISCFNTGDGTITIIASGGSGGYDYRIHNSVTDDWTAWQVSNVFENLTPATYTIEVRDSNGCVQTECTIP